MTIPSAAKPTPLPKVNASLELVGRDGRPTVHGLKQMEAVRGYVNGAGRIIPCSCTGTNTLTLTPNGHGSESGEAPTIEGYRFGDMYLFWAENNSTNSVTATVVTKTDSLGTIKVYIAGGSAQAGNGDITANLVYLGMYAPHLDSNAGGLVIRHP